jgi:hypothetical protein
MGQNHNFVKSEEIKINYYAIVFNLNLDAATHLDAKGPRRGICVRYRQLIGCEPVKLMGDFLGRTLPVQIYLFLSVVFAYGESFTPGVSSDFE